MGRVTRWGAVAAAALLAIGLAACGDDDDGGSEDATPTETATEGDLASFCDALVGFNQAALDAEVDDTSPEEDIVAAGEELTPLSEALVENAPEAIADDAAEIDGFVQPLLDGDAGPFSSDETFETYTSFVGLATEECEFETIEVTGVDYAFEDVPATVEAGTYAFSFTNASEAEEHEMLLVRKAEGVTQSFDEILSLSEDESESLVEFRGAAFAGPGGDSGTLAELDPGDYAMVCFIPVGGADDGPPHFTQGMVAEFTVE